MREETDWKPTEEEVAWTRAAVEQLDDDGGVWSPHGLEYQRHGNSLKLVSMVHHAGTVEAHSRICKVMDDMGWNVYDDSVERVSHEVPPELIASQQEEELKRIQHIVSGWLCTNDECGEHIVNMPLHEVAWVNHGKQPFVNPQTGDEGEADRWLAHIHCHSCSTEIQMNPLDYGYIAGEDLFYSWRYSDDKVFRVLTREDTVNLIDAGLEGTALGSVYDDEPVPPHMQGTYCITLDWTELKWKEEE
jgi:hypothetical protein